MREKHFGQRTAAWPDLDHELGAVQLERIGNAA
jgi:hypothetical protein